VLGLGKSGGSSGLLYHRVYRKIADEIAAGVLAPGERLPPERELCERLAISRATVRRALKELIADGLIEAQQGSGTFVASVERVGEMPNALQSFTDLGRMRGLDAAAKVLSSVVRPSSLDEADVFAIAPGAKVFELRRVRYLDSLPVAVGWNVVPLAVAPSLPETDFTSASLYAVLENHGAGPVRADYTVEACGADADTAASLECEVGGSVLRTRTIGRDESGRVVENSEVLYRADRYRFRATLRRRG
jgi:DNA-binding GntR family transcriptional regulator